MPPRKRSGRAAAEAAYANLLKDNTTLVGDVGASYDAYVTKLEDAAAARERYEQARAAAIKGGAVTNDQLDQMDYKKTAKLPSLAAQTPDSGAVQRAAQSHPQTNGAAPEPALVSAGAGNREDN